MKVDDALLAFLTVLRTSWTSVKDCLVAAGWDDSASADWVQANWEMIVEAAVSRDVSTVLQVYADGADCNGGSSRVWRPEVAPTHRILCLAKATPVVEMISGKPVNFPPEGLPLDEFVALTSDWFERCPPFDCVLLSDGDADARPVVVRVMDVTFACSPL